MNQDPFAPKYGAQQQPQQQPAPQPPEYGGMPVGQPKKGMNMLLIPFVLSVVFLVGAIGFGIWAFMGMQDYKNNVDQKIEAAVTVKEQEVASAKEVEFVEREKNPLKEYRGPGNFGTVTVKYPKTWAAYVREEPDSSTPIDGFFHPGFVPSEKNKPAYALRIEVLDKTYADILRSLDGKVKQGKIKASAYTSDKLPKGTVGTRLEGEIITGQQDTMVVFALRDKTLQISTQSPQFVKDFDGIIMQNLSFIP